MELNKIHLFLAYVKNKYYLFLSAEFTSVLFKWGFNSYTKCMKPFFVNVKLNPVDTNCFWSVIFDYAGAA